MILLRIGDRADWELAVASGVHRPETVVRHGFIHSSRVDQVIPVASHHFRGRKGLALLVIDSDRVTAEVRYENLEGGQELHPHIYGPLNSEAVIRAVPFDPREDGRYDLPRDLE